MTAVPPSSLIECPILLAEDSAVNTRIVVAQLKRCGYTAVTCVANGRLAVDAVVARATAAASSSPFSSSSSSSSLPPSDFKVFLCDVEMPVS